jgi:NAD(P)-dependent dehydrogenase (short-subunit alcohol dehydrogenase family)
MSSPVAIITGASSGIGAALALAFADAGYRVMAAGRNIEKLDEVSAHSPSITSWVGDLTDPAACEKLVADTLEACGAIDVLINNAGVIVRAEAADTSTEDWRYTMGVNIDAPFFLSRAAVPALLASRGAIINIASDWGLQGGQKAVAYCASKGALVLMTRAMALDHAHQGLRVNAICPGDVETPMLTQEAIDLGRNPADAIRDCDADSPTGRVTQPEEVAALALFLASDAARQITGTAIPIDGGNSA